MANELAQRLRLAKAFFDRSTSRLEEADSGFAPRPGMLTVAQQVAHAAHTVDWFLEGAFAEGGLDADFEAHARLYGAVGSLAEARAWLDRAFAAAIRKAEALPETAWREPVRGDLLGGMRRASIVGGIAEHTAHHRGALAVYQRLLGKVPEMPYA